jgi:hypothetical protein
MYGTDKIVLTMKKRDIAAAREEAARRAMRIGKKGVEVVDVIPCRWVDGQLVEYKRRVKTTKGGKLVNQRKARARASVRSTRRVSL